jgi:selenocysteine lyase/cysteine desulfurase
MINWEELRDEHLENYTGVHLNSPANGIPSLATEAFVAAEVLKFRETPGQYRTDFISTAIPAIKQQVADLIRAKTSEVALIQNFSIGLNLFVQSLPAKTKILLIEHDYPSLTTPFQINDFEITWTTFEDDHTLNLNKIEEAIKRHKPAFFALSHCQYLTGYLADLDSIGAICKQYNCKFIVDATQSFGSISIDVKKCNISILGASCYKWALAGFGNGFLYINENTLNTIAAAMLSYKATKNFTLNASGKYVGQQYLDNTESKARSLDAFTNVDLSINYISTEVKGTKTLDVGLFLNNVLNQYYAPNGYTFSGIIGGERQDFNYLYPMAGFNWMMKVSMTL